MFDVHSLPKTNLPTSFSLNRVILISIIAVCLLWVVHAPVSLGQTPDHFSGLNSGLGDRDAVMVAAPDGRVLFAHQPGVKLVPASTIKLLTALAAFHYLGPDFRFVTKFYLDSDSSLKIKGQGDPLLVSEVIEDISKTLAEKLDRFGLRLNHIVLDNTYFKSPIPIPGVSGSSEPYDAPNGALCVNFNTVNFKTDQGIFVSAEPQTPLLPMVLPEIKTTGLKKGRITLSHTQDEITYYAGHLFRYFLGQNGQGNQGTIKIDSVGSRDRLFLTYRSVYTLTQTVMKMLTFSNNFMANQIFLYTGATQYGGPATLEKGVRAVGTYARGTLGLESVVIAEGSGISRNNRVSAEAMMTVLDVFEPYHSLMKHNGNHFFKTGHLKGIRTQVGYYRIKEKGLYRYVILLNTPGKTVRPVVDSVVKILDGGD